MKYPLIFAIGSTALAVVAPVSIDIAERSTTVVTGGTGIGFESKGSGGDVVDSGNGGNIRKGDGGDGDAGGTRGGFTSLIARKFDIISNDPATSFIGNSHGGDVGYAGNRGNGGNKSGSGGSSAINTGK